MEEMIPKDFYGEALMSGWQMSTTFQQGGLTIRRPSEPAPTVIAMATQPSCRPIVITRLRTGTISARVLTLDAIAALQSFPNDYDWGTSIPTALRTIGNAVPPKLMTKIIEANL
jgi:site-specific DNA-cytosine methylase